MADPMNDAGGRPTEATEGGDAASTRGGCLNLGWGCLPVLVGGVLLLPLGLFMP